MDKKTCKYMNDRVKAFDALEDEKKGLESCKSNLLKYGGFAVRINDGYNSFYKKSEIK